MENMLFLSCLVTIYLFLIAYLGYRGYHGTKNATDYLIAGRKAHPFVMAMSYGAAFISTSAIVGFGGAASVYGMGILWLPALNVLVGVFIAFVFIGARTRAMGHRLNAHTFPELLGRRYDSGFLALFTALIIIVFMPLYAGVVLIGAAKFIEVRTGANYETALFFFSALVAVYVIMGGLKGVMLADAAQGTIMLAGILLVIFFTYYKLGGIVAAHQQLSDMAPLVPDNLVAAGHRGWTSMPEFGSANWWTLVSTIVLGVGVGVLAQPQLVVRYMTVKGTMELNRAVLIGGIFITLMTGGAYVTGALSNVFFFNDPEIGAVSIVASQGDVEQIIPMFIKRYMPFWLGDVFFVTLMAAAMSTASGLFHAMGTAAGRDLLNFFSKKEDSEMGIFAARIGILVTFLFSVLLAYVLPAYFESGLAIVARGTAVFFGLCAAAFLPMYVGGLYSKRITKTAAIAGALTGFFASLFWLVFVSKSSAKSLLLCNALLGRENLFGDARTGFILWSHVDTILIALPLSILVTVVVSLVTKPFAKKHIDACFHR
jgi:solute:Na+ symporter, SSS family